MRIDVFTIFPDMVEGFCGHSLLGKARAAGLVDVRVHDLRRWAGDPHRSVDDAPFGGGAGMVIAPEPVFTAIEAVEPPRPLLLAVEILHHHRLALVERLFQFQRQQRLARRGGRQTHRAASGKRRHKRPRIRRGRAGASPGVSFSRDRLSRIQSV